jgi:hypothetical protein
VGVVLWGFPAAVRRQWKPILLAAILLYGPALAAYVAVWTQPSNTRLFVPDSVVEKVEERAKKKLTTGWGANTSY